MLMKPEPLFRAVRTILPELNAPVILLTPQGRTFSHTVAQELAGHDRLVLLCGHYEGVDERVRQHLVTDELSIGDYVLMEGSWPRWWSWMRWRGSSPAFWGQSKGLMRILLPADCWKGRSIRARRILRGGVCRTSCVPESRRGSAVAARNGIAPDNGAAARVVGTGDIDAKRTNGMDTISIFFR
jgi:hypothetical protein